MVPPLPAVAATVPWTPRCHASTYWPTAVPWTSQAHGRHSVPQRALMLALGSLIRFSSWAIDCTQPYARITAATRSLLPTWSREGRLTLGTPTMLATYSIEVHTVKLCWLMLFGTFSSFPFWVLNLITIERLYYESWIPTSLTLSL